jgi:hypothetical protein
MLAAAWLNWQKSHEAEQTIFGCYTISDSWTFLQGVVKDFEADRPLMTVENSREYIQRLEAVTIFQILKFIIDKSVNPYSGVQSFSFWDSSHGSFYSGVQSFSFWDS